MKRITACLVPIFLAVAVSHAAPTPERAGNTGTTAAPARFQQNLADLAVGPKPYRWDVHNYFHVRGARFNTISNLMPIAEVNIMMMAPNQDYMFYKTENRNLMSSVRVADAIDTTPGYPSPPTPTAPFSDDFSVRARLINSYTDVDSGLHNALAVIVSNAENRLILVGMKNDIDDSDLSDGRKLVGSAAERESLMLSYGRKIGNGTLSYSYLETDFDDATVPALTMDVSDAEATAHILRYEISGDDLSFHGEVRRVDVEREMDTYNYRPWLPAGVSIDDATGVPAVFTTPESMAYYGEINSLVRVPQDIDSWEYRLELSRPLGDAYVRAGFDGVLNDVVMNPRKPWDDPRFETIPTSPFRPVTAPVDWRYFDIKQDIEDNTLSAYAEIDYPIGADSNLYLGARVTRHELAKDLVINPDGVDGRFVYEVLGLRYLIENIYGVTYTEPTDPNNPLLNDPNPNTNPTPAGQVGPILDDDHNTVDAVVRLTRSLNDKVSVSAGIAWLEERPVAFERIFPADFDPASNVLDGQAYLGQPGLDEETHKQVELALSYDNLRNFHAQARIWYNRVDDYIQGVPVIETTTDPVEIEAAYEVACGSLQYAPPAAMAPAGVVPYFYDGVNQFPCLNSNPLRYDNIDAKLYGIDLNWGFRFSDKLLFTGVAAWQRGERRDDGLVHNNVPVNLIATPGGPAPAPPGTEAKIVNAGYETVSDDDLYRIMPPYAQMALIYTAQKWHASVEGTFFMEQDDVSRTNEELKTPGYGVINTVFTFAPHPALRLDFGVNNVFDKNYTNHLTGENRRFNNTSRDASSPAGVRNDAYLNYRERIPGLERNYFAKLTLSMMWPLPKRQ